MKGFEITAGDVRKKTCCSFVCFCLFCLSLLVFALVYEDLNRVQAICSKSLHFFFKLIEHRLDLCELNQMNTTLYKRIF